MDLLEKLQAECKFSITIEINPHRDFYQSIDDFIDDRQDSEDVDGELLVRMIESDRMVRIQFYPETAGGFNVAYGESVEEALANSLIILGVAAN